MFAMEKFDKRPKGYSGDMSQKHIVAEGLCFCNGVNVTGPNVLKTSHVAKSILENCIQSQDFPTIEIVV